MNINNKQHNNITTNSNKQQQTTINTNITNNIKRYVDVDDVEDGVNIYLKRCTEEVVIHTYIHKHINTYMYIYIYTNIHKHISTYLYIYIHTLINKYMHTYITYTT